MSKNPPLETYIGPYKPRQKDEAYLSSVEFNAFYPNNLPKNSRGKPMFVKLGQLIIQRITPQSLSIIVESSLFLFGEPILLILGLWMTLSVHMNSFSQRRESFATKITP